MEKEIVTIYSEGTGTYEEKKSRFLACIRQVRSEEEAMSFLQETRKKYYDASHNCYAYVLGDRGEIQKASDDGEPSGTAGHPILAVLNGAGLTNVCLIVTRYFGGTLLGTGGLVRSYTKASQDAVNNAIIARKKLSDVLLIHTDYNGLGKLQYYFATEGMTPKEILYGESVLITLPVEVDRTDMVIKKATDLTNGKAVISKDKQVYSAVIENQVMLFEG